MKFEYRTAAAEALTETNGNSRWLLALFASPIPEDINVLPATFDPQFSDMYAKADVLLEVQAVNGQGSVSYLLDSTSRVKGDAPLKHGYRVLTPSNILTSATTPHPTLGMSHLLQGAEGLYAFHLGERSIPANSFIEYVYDTVQKVTDVRFTQYSTDLYATKDWEIQYFDESLLEGAGDWVAVVQVQGYKEHNVHTFNEISTKRIRLIILKSTYRSLVVNLLEFGSTVEPEATTSVELKLGILFPTQINHNKDYANYPYFIVSVGGPNTGTAATMTENIYVAGSEARLANLCIEFNMMGEL